jgi:putative transposase
VSEPPSYRTRKGTAKKNVSAVRLVERDEAGEVPELSEELRVALSNVAEMAREGLLAMSVSVGLGVMPR